MPSLSIVVPTLNAEPVLPATLNALRGSLAAEIVLSDGGSHDRTCDIAAGFGARVVTGPRGRGGQLRRGVAAATGDWFLFLHADTVLDASWPGAVNGHLAQRPDMAGYFRFRLDDDTPAAARLARGVAWRSRSFGLPYGDQGLLISRTLYEAVDGYRDIALMEDVDLVRRIGKRRLAALDCDAVTSADKFRRDGYWRRSARNLVCLGLYFAGVDPKTIARVYG